MRPQPKRPERRVLLKHHPSTQPRDWRNGTPLPYAQSRPKLSVWKRLHLEVKYLQSVPATSYGNMGSMVEDQVDIRGWARFVRLCLGCFILLPLSIILSYAVIIVLNQVGAEFSMDTLLRTPVWFTLLGALTYTIVQMSKLVSRTLIYSYVLGHELTHGLAALMCFGKIHRLKIDINGGYVETDKSNFFISLAPYFLPLWMLLWVGIFTLTGYIHPFHGCEQLLYGGLGFWWAFHIYWTLWIIPREQPDLLENGLFFSTLLIWVMNLIMLGIILLVYGLADWQNYGDALTESITRLTAFMKVLLTWLSQLQ